MPGSTPDPDLDQLRTVLDRARHEARLTFEELAAVSGVSRQTLLNLSHGRHYGDLKTWLKLSRALDRGLDDLLAPVWGDRPRDDR